MLDLLSDFILFSCFVSLVVIQQQLIIPESHQKNMQGTEMRFDLILYFYDHFSFRANGYSDLADRLVELQYELTDRLTCFIGGKRPEHKTGLHIILPELNEKYVE